MTTLSTQALPEADDDDMAGALADGFADQIRCWSLTAGAPAAVADIVAMAARALSLATGAGHACLHPQALADLPVDPGPSGWRQALLASGVVAPLQVASPATPIADTSPLVIDDDTRLYLRRYADYEQRLAAQVIQRVPPAAVGGCAPPDDAAALSSLFASLFPSPGPLAAADQANLAGRQQGSSLTDAQQSVARLVMAGRLVLVSGGPGTGKTSSVVAMLASLLTRWPDLRVVLAAPTGKAAARMLESLNLRARSLPEPLRSRMPAQAFTLHRLLGTTGDSRRPVGGRQRRLALDLLVVDESSMLDLALATRLFEALPDDARMVLLGDRDQLSAVEAGSVFADLAGAPAPIAGQVVTLTHSHRFAADSGIGRLAADIRAGRGQASLDWIDAGRDEQVTWIDEAGGTLSPAAWEAIVQGYGDYFRLLAPAPVAAPLDDRRLAALFRAFESFRVLCAVRGGPRGVDRLNALLERPLRVMAGVLPAAAEGSPWFHGRPVIVTRNDPAPQLFNGDIGLCLADDQGQLSVWFAQADGSYRRVGIARMPAHQSALAMTVHKSQGSEFDRVMLLLAGPASPLNTRELLYTAVTRARDHVWLAGQRQAWLAGCANPVRRDGGLPARLCDAWRAFKAPETP